MAISGPEAKYAKTYHTKLKNPTDHKAPTSYKKAGNREQQWFEAEDKERDGMLEFNTLERIPQATVTKTMRAKALRAHHIYDIKRDGSFKSRVVTGRQHHTDTYTDTTSPVAFQLQLRTLLAMIAY